MNKCFIWDMDGTLIDSYPQIMESLRKTNAKFNISKDDDFILKIIKNKTVLDYFKMLVEENPSLKLEDLTKFAKEKENETKFDTCLIEGVKETLEYLHKKGYKNYIYTHKDNSAFEILKRLKIDCYFDDVITSNLGLKRKPEPDGILYLVDKYNLDKENTFYIGDRPIDVECALKSKVKAIFFLEKGSACVSKGEEDILITKISDLIDIF